MVVDLYGAGRGTYCGLRPLGKWHRTGNQWFRTYCHPTELGHTILRVGPTIPRRTAA